VACIDRRAFLLEFSTVWGVIWLVIAFIFFLLGIMVGILAFKVRHSLRCTVFLCCSLLRVIVVQQSAAQQKEDAEHFLPVPGSNGAIAMPLSAPLALLVSTLSSALLSLL